MRWSKIGGGALFLAAMAAVGCGGSHPNDGGVTDAGGGTDSGPGADAGNGADAGQGHSFDTAIPLTLGAATHGVLPSASAQDYYSLALTHGDRMVIVTQTDAGTNTSGAVTDTVVTLWNPARTRIARDDDAWPRLSTDSTLYVQIPADGTYYLTVEDCNSAFGSGCYPAAMVSDFHYTLFAAHVSQASFPETNAAATQDGTTAHAQTVTYSLPPMAPAGAYGMDVLDGAFRSTTDTHVFSLTPPANTQVSAGQRARMEFFFQPIGTTNGDGSTANAKVWLTDSTGTKIIAQASQSNYLDGDNQTNGPLDLSVPVTLGQQYYLFTQNLAAASNPATDYYFTQHFVGAWFYGQAEVEGLAGGANDSFATAEVLTTPQGATAGSFFIDGDISPATDVDWYQTTPPAGTKSVSMSCRAARSGSGLVGLSATLYDTTGTTALGTIGPETATADLSSQTIPMPDGGITKGYLKISAASQDATNTGTSYWCGVFYSNM